MLLRVDCGVILQDILGHYRSIVRYSSIDWLNIISLFIWSWPFRHGKIALFVTPLFEVFFSFWDIHDIWYSRYPCFMSGWWPFMSFPTNTKVPGVKTISQYPTMPPQPNSSRQHRQHSLVQRFSFRSSTFRSVVASRSGSLGDFTPTYRVTI